MLEEHLAAVLDRERTGTVGILHAGLLAVHNAEARHIRIRNRRVDRAAIHSDGTGVGGVCRIIAPHARTDRDACGKSFRITADTTSGAIDNVVGVEGPVGLDDDFRSDRRRRRVMDAAAADARRIATSVRDERTRFNHDLACTGTRGIVRIAKADAGGSIAGIGLDGRAVNNQRPPFAIADFSDADCAGIAARLAEEPAVALKRERAGFRKRPRNAGAKLYLIAAIDIDRARRIRRHRPCPSGVDAADRRLDRPRSGNLVRR